MQSETPLLAFETICNLRNQGKTWEEIARIDGTSLDRVKKRFYQERSQYQASPLELTPSIPPSQPTTSISFPPSTELPDADYPIYLDLGSTKGNILCIGDLHVPYHNTSILESAIRITRDQYPDVHTLIIGGDIFDFASLSSYSHNQPEVDPNDTIQLAGDVLRALAAYLPQIKHMVICSGNHDERFSRKLDRSFSLQLLINAAFGQVWPKGCKVQITNLDYIYLGKDNEPGAWVIGHPSSYSGISAKTPADMADIYQRHTMTFHNHISGIGQSKSGRYIAVDAGHCTQPDSHYYQVRRLTKFARWTAGFCILKGGYPHLYNDLITDWSCP